MIRGMEDYLNGCTDLSLSISAQQERLDQLARAADVMLPLAPSSVASNLRYTSTVEIGDWNEDSIDELILHTQEISSRRGPYGGLSIAAYWDRETSKWQGKQIWHMDYHPDPQVRKLNLHDSQGNPFMLVSGIFVGADRVDDVLYIWRWRSDGPELAKEIWLNNWHTWHEWEATDEGAILVHATEATSRSAASPATIYVLRGDVFVAERPYSLPMSVPSVQPVSPPAESISATAYPGWTMYTNADHVSDLAFDFDGNPWAVGNGGIVRWNLADRTYTRYTIDTGLPSNRVSSVAAGTDGTLWFGLQTNGVLQFDGRSWTHHTEHCGLAENAVNTISVAPDGTLWFGLSGGGICRFDGQTWTSFTTADGLANDYVCSVDASLGDTLWVGGCGPWVSHFDGKVWTSYGPADGLVSGIGGSIAATSNGEVWFSTYIEEGIFDTGGLAHFDGQTWITHTESSGMVHRNIGSIATTADGAVWFATGHSLSRFTGAETAANGNETWPTYICPLSDEITSLVVAPDGALWVSTWGGGISRFDGQTWTTYAAGDGPADNHIGFIAVAPDGTAWIGTHSGLSRFEASASAGEDHVWTTYTTDDGLPGNNIRSIAVGVDGTLWVGTGYGISRFTDPFISTDGELTWKTYSVYDGLESDLVDALAIAPDGTVWAGTWYGGVSCLAASTIDTGDGETWVSFTPADGLVDHMVSAIAVDHSGTVWAGTFEGVSVLGEGTWTTLNRAGLRGTSITAITVAPDGSLWFAADDGNVLHFDGQDWTAYGRFRRESVVIAAAPDGTMWFGAAKGISRFDGETWTTYDTADGLVDDRVTAVAVAPDGAVWIGTGGGGVARFVPPDYRAKP
jgi:ligand-binding sensor domain-containing protein